jgi:hypothetical protein
MGNLIRRLRVLEHRGDGSARADGLDKLLTWRAGATARLNRDATSDDIWAWIETMSTTQLDNFRVVAASEGASFARDLAQQGYLGDDTRRALAGNDDLLSMVEGLQPAELTEREFQALDKSLMGVLYGRTGETDGAAGSLPGALAGDDLPEGLAGDGSG